MSEESIEHACEGLPSCHSFYVFLSDPMSGYLSTCLWYDSRLYVCRFLSCQIECSKLQALSESPQEVYMSTIRVVILWLWFHCFRVLVECELYHHQNWGVMCHVPGTNTPIHIRETPATFQTSFLETILGDLVRLSCLELATEPSPHSADGSFPAATQPGGFSAARLRKAPLDGPLAWMPREQWQLLALRSHFSSVPVFPSAIGLLSQSVMSHTTDSRRSLTVLTLCQRREEWDLDQPAVLTANSC